MSLNDITNKILSDAKGEAAKIREAGQKDLETTLANKNEEIVAAVKTLKDKAAKGAERLKKQAEFKKRMTEKTEILKAKQGLISEAFVNAKEQLSDLNEPDFIKLMVKLLKDSPKLDKATIITNNKHKDSVAQALKEAGLDYALSDKSLPAGEKGFIVTSDDIEIDYTFNNLVNGLKSELEGEVVKVLFE